MAKYKPLSITYAESGLIRDKQAFVTANDAYVELFNAYVWRGITKRRLDSSFLGRLRRAISAQALANTLNNVTYNNGGADILTSFRATQANASIQCGSLVIVIDRGGANETTLTDQGDGTFSAAGFYTLSSSSINYNTGIISATFTVALTAALSVDATYGYYPCLPTMGILEYERPAIKQEQYIFFDTVYAYQLSGSSFVELPSTAATTWTGSNSDFFNSANYWTSGGQDLFWVTNGNFGATVATTDPIRYYDSATWNATPFLPAITNGATDALISAKLIFPYRNRLVVLNTLEATNTTGPTATISYPNRARWSQNGDPTDIVNGWLDNVQGRGGFNDAPTNEAIIGADFVRDTLIVFFESSTWKLRYTGNEILPFVWERINKELGAESTRTVVPFDEGLLAVGDKGVIRCNGNTVQRIDASIRDFVFRIHNDNDGVRRVHGIRNFFEQLVYWTLPSESGDRTFPNRILLYNYDNDSWALFTDHFTALGPFQRANDVAWQDLTDVRWADYRQAWNSGKGQSGFPLIAGGNQQGFIHLLNQKTSPDESLHIFAVTAGTPPTIQIPNHNLSDGDIIEINEIQTSATGAEALNGYRYQVLVVDANNLQIQETPKFTITAITAGTTTTVTATGNNMVAGDRVEFQNVGGMTEINDLTGTVLTEGNTFTVNIDSTGFANYTTGGTVQNLDGLFEDVILSADNYIGCGVVKRITGFSIKSKKFSSVNQAMSSQLGYIDLLVDRAEGEVSIPIFADYNSTDRINPRTGDRFFNSEFSTNIDPEDTVNTTKVWHRVFCTLRAQFVQYQLTLDQAQVLSKQFQAQDFILDSVVLWTDQGGRLTR